MTDQKITVLYQLCWKSLGGKAHHTWSRRGNRRWKGSEAGGSLVAHSPAVRANRQDRSDSHSAWNSEHNVYKSPCYVSKFSPVVMIQMTAESVYWQIPSLQQSFNLSVCAHLCSLAAHDLFTASWHRYTEVIQMCVDPLRCWRCCSPFCSKSLYCGCVYVKF